MKTRVVLEVAPKRAFASALDWPGWSRGARTPEEALDALVAYGPRYAKVAKRAKVAYSPPRDVSGLEVVERLKGGSGTEFGVPGAWTKRESDPVKPAERQAAHRPAGGDMGHVRRHREEGDRRRADEGSAWRGSRARQDHRPRPRGRGRVPRPARLAATASRRRGSDEADGAAPDRLRGSARGCRRRPAVRESEEHEEAMVGPIHDPPIGLARPRPCLGDRRPLDPGADAVQISARASSAVSRIGLPSGSSTIAAYGPSDFHGAFRPA